MPLCKAPLDDKPYTTRRHYQPFGADHIRAELFARGPVQATFTVYADLLNPFPQPPGFDLMAP